MLETQIKGVVEIVGVKYVEGRPCYMAHLVSDNDQVIYFYEGQLKYVNFQLESGKRYEVTFEPFVNNRWVDLRLIAMNPVAESSD